MIVVRWLLSQFEVFPVRRLVIIIGALALLLAACGGSGQVVATVDGNDITMAYVEQLSGNDAGSVSREQFVSDLQNSIIEAVVIDAAKDLGVSFTDEEIDARYESLKNDITSQTGMEYETFLEQQGLTDDRVRRIAHQQLISDGVEAALKEQAGPVTDEQIETAYQQGLYDYTEACVSHILTETEEEAQAARQRILDGEDFADVATDVSIDPSAATNAGDLGCSSLGGYVPEFAQGVMDANIGEVTEPVRSQYGYHLILVTERTTQPLDEVRDQVAAQVDALRGGNMVQDWLLEVIAAADVQVDEEYGTWVGSPTPTIVPPES